MCDTVCEQLPAPSLMDPCPDRPVLYTKLAASNPDRGPLDHLKHALPEIDDMEMTWAAFQQGVREMVEKHKLENASSTGPSSGLEAETKL